VIAALMLYGLVIATCLAIAALAAERVARVVGRPLRWVWVGALVALVALLAAIPLRRVAVVPATESVPEPAVRTSITADILFSASRRVPPVAGEVLGAAWLVASGGLALLLVGVHVRYRRLRARWPMIELGGHVVRVAPSDGPAVLGTVRPEIVVPRWLLDCRPAEQRMVVAHEAEHVSAGDPALLTVAWVVAIAMPWNLPVWWIVSRLRLAVELDCDARVLGAGTPAGDYANVLIDIAAEHAGLRLAAPAFLGFPTHLHRRLTAMYADSVRFRSLRAAAASAVAVAALVAACGTELPSSLDSLDAAAAERLARQSGAIGDSVVFTVDGVRVSPDEAKLVPASRIARVETVRGSGGQASTISVWTVDSMVVSRNVEPTGSWLIDDRPVTIQRRTSNSGPFKGLVILDGKRFDPATMGQIKASSIESVEVLRGAAARRFYPEPASEFGVIIITTKR
jgi:beta-lactamase regulating signal transducer with metallopeptidase domain